MLFFALKSYIKLNSFVFRFSAIKYRARVWSLRIQTSCKPMSKLPVISTRQKCDVWNGPQQGLKCKFVDYWQRLWNEVKYHQILSVLSCSNNVNYLKFTWCLNSKIRTIMSHLTQCVPKKAILWSQALVPHCRMFEFKCSLIAQECMAENFMQHMHGIANLKINKRVHSLGA